MDRDMCLLVLYEKCVCTLTCVTAKRKEEAKNGGEVRLHINVHTNKNNVCLFFALLRYTEARHRLEHITQL